MKKIRIYKSRLTQFQDDTDYNFIQWIATSETLIAICEDIKTGLIFQFKLNEYQMSFVKEEHSDEFAIWKI